VNFFQTERKRGDGDRVRRSQRYFRDPNPRFDINEPHFWKKDTCSTTTCSASRRTTVSRRAPASQYTAHHQIKVGGDFQRHTLRFFNHFFPVQLGGTNPNVRDWDGYGYDLVVDTDASGNPTNIILEENATTIRTARSIRSRSRSSRRTSTSAKA
jgi:hypothetical protein